MTAPADMKPGFQILLQRIAAEATTLGAAVDAVLTLGGRQERAYGLSSLTPLQRAFVDALDDDARALPLGDRDGAWHVGQWSYGRIWLARTPPTDPECRSFGAVSLPAALEDAVAARAEELTLAARACDAEMHAFFDGLDAAGLARVLHEVHETVDHTDPVLFYVGDDTITNFGKFNNLQERGADLPECFHRRAKDTPRDRWSEAERIYVFCVHWLRAAGLRGEEFCGRQLNPAALRDALDEQLAQYRALRPGEEPRPASGIAEEIADKARLLARLRAEGAGELLTYRVINGLTFYKEERLLPRARAAAAWPSVVPEAVRAYVASACGIDATGHASAQALFHACVARMAARGFAGADARMNAAEALLKAIVDDAVDATGSDVGMCRGTRDMARLMRAFAAERWDEICALQNTDYFCAVFPSAPFRARLADKPELLVKILYACSARMQFNHWHYMPGHCPPESVPADRHYYWPPRVPDIAAWSDQHHTGHVLAEVRYSIRSPAPLVLNGTVRHGMLDLRLFRQSGAPYSEDDLVTALRYTELLRALQQALADHLARDDTSAAPVCITAFGKDWYRDYYGGASAGAANDAAAGRHAAHAAAGTHAAAPPEELQQRVDAVAAANASNGASSTPGAGAVGARSPDGGAAGPATALFRLLCKHAADPKKVALVEARQPAPDVSLRYRALVAHAQALADAVAAGALAPGDVVAVLSQRPLHQAVALVAGMANGLIVNPLNPALAPQMLAAQLEHAQPRWLIVDGTVAPPPDLSRDTRVVSWDDAFAGAAQHEAQALPAVAGDDHERAPEEDGRNPGGLVIYTSGTTGASKGVHLAWSHIEANVRYAIDALGFAEGQVTGSLLPRFHTFTLISDLFPALFLGGKTVLADAFDLGNVKWTVDAFLRHGVQSYSAVPIIFDAFCALSAWAGAKDMRMAVAGAAPLKESTRVAYGKAFGHPIIPCYGLSETTCFAAISPRDAIREGAVGRPAGIEIRVVDDKGAPVAAGVTGELFMRGPSVISGGYFKDAGGQFASAFTADGWFKTGDIGRIDDDGYVFVTGRKKNMVIRGGEKVYLEDVDRCLADFLGVLDCASVVLCEPGQPDQSLTFIVTSGAPLPIDELNAHVRASLSAHHVPDRIYFVERIPRTPTGKSSIPELLRLSKAMKAA